MTHAKPIKKKKPKAPHKRYFNRELSWLKFNWRVLEEADNSSYPLLERIRFLSISGSNLDEFFMVRVAGLMGQQSRGIDETSVDGRTPGQQLKAIAKDSDALMVRQQKIWAKLKRRLASKEIKLLALSSVGKIAMKQLEKYFTGQILPGEIFHRTDIADVDAAGAGPCTSVSLYPKFGPQPDL